MLERRVVVHDRTGQHREQLPGPPQGDVDPFLGLLLLPVRDQHLERRTADLGMAGFVGLDAGNQVGEGMVAGLRRICGEAEKLHVGEAGLETEGEHDRDADRVARHHDVVEEMARGDHRPFIGVVGLEGPIHLPVLGHVLMGEVELHLAMADFIHAAQRGHVAHPRRLGETHHPGLGAGGRIFAAGNRAVMGLHHRFPTGVGVLEDAAAFQRGLHRIGAGILFALDLHIFRIGLLVGLVVFFPRRQRQAEFARQLGREQFVLGDVFGSPIGGTGQVIPVHSIEYGHRCLRQ